MLICSRLRPALRALWLPPLCSSSLSSVLSTTVVSRAARRVEPGSRPSRATLMPPLPLVAVEVMMERCVPSRSTFCVSLLLPSIDESESFCKDSSSPFIASKPLRAAFARAACTCCGGVSFFTSGFGASGFFFVFGITGSGGGAGGIGFYWKTRLARQGGTRSTSPRASGGSLIAETTRLRRITATSVEMLRMRKRRSSASAGLQGNSANDNTPRSRSSLRRLVHHGQRDVGVIGLGAGQHDLLEQRVRNHLVAHDGALAAAVRRLGVLVVLLRLVIQFFQQGGDDVVARLDDLGRRRDLASLRDDVLIVLGDDLRVFRWQFRSGLGQLFGLGVRVVLHVAGAYEQDQHQHGEHGDHGDDGDHRVALVAAVMALHALGAARHLHGRAFAAAACGASPIDSSGKSSA